MYQITPTPIQWEILQSNARHKVIVAGRRGGKSYLGKTDVLLHADKPNQNIAAVYPTHGMAKRLIWKPLKQALPRWAIRSKNESDLTIELRNGSTIMVGGGHNPDTWRGPGYDYILIDECQDCDTELWDEVLYPALTDRQGSSVRIGTPKGRSNHLYAWYNEAVRDSDSAGFTYTTAQGGLVKPEELAKARAKLDVRTYRQEFEASFEESGDAAYYAFSPASICKQAFLPDADTWLCWDFNAGEKPMACIILQRGALAYYVTKEFVMQYTQTETMCEIVSDWLTANKFTGRLRITGDYSGKSVRSTATRSDYAIIENTFKNWNGYKVATRPTRKVRDRVSALNSLFLSASKIRRLFVADTCEHLIEDLTLTEWKDNGYELDGRNPKRTHASDALSYFAYNEHPIENIKLSVTVS